MDSAHEPMRFAFVGRIRRKPPSGTAALPDGAALIGPTGRGRGFVGRIRRKPPSGNGPGMCHWWKGSVHQGDGLFINHLCGERDKGSGRAPLVNPRGPARKSVLRTALTSRVPDCGRLDSTSCLGSPLSAIHGVQTLSFPLRFADFSGDTTPIAVISQIKKTGVAETLPDGAYRLSGLRSADA